ncbi:hypothetical protein E2320_002060 [Naja naja]|nr:hypothetical protein E2320_002060 [Naja naja]
MDERSSYKNKNREKYNELQKIIRKIQLAKEKWFAKRYKEIEETEHIHNHFNLNKKVKEAAGLYKKKATNNLVDKEGKIILNEDEKLIRWKKYIEELFEDTRGDIDVGSITTGPNIIMEEVEHAIKIAKTRKATGPDDIPVEILKLLENSGKKFLLQLFNQIYETGKIPDDWLKSTFVTTPQKINAKKCTEYRTISLTSHVLKIFLRIIDSRIYKKIEEHLNNKRFGFRNNLGTQDGLFSIQVLAQHCRDVNHSVYMCFIDFEKALIK